MSVETQVRDASRRTRLAGERTQLAWWRTGLTAIAVAVALGRVVPDLGHSGAKWPYTLIGAGFALYGVALIVYGTVRVREVESAIKRGEFSSPSDRFIAAITVAGALLGMAAFALILID